MLFLLRLSSEISHFFHLPFPVVFEILPLVADICPDVVESEPAERLPSGVILAPWILPSEVIFPLL